MVKIQDIESLPKDWELEKNILGYLIQNSDELEMVGNLKPYHFDKKENQSLFKLMKRLDKNGKDFDLQIIKSEYKNSKKLKKKISKGYIDSLMSSGLETMFSGIDGIEAYADRIITLYSRRKGIKRIAQRQAQLYNTDIPLETTLNKTTSDIDSCMPNGKAEAKSLYEAVLDIEENWGMNDRVIPTGYSALDKRPLRGSDKGGIGATFEKGQLNIIAARPAMGKTTFMRNLVGNQVKNKKHCAVFSLEMGTVQIGKRMMAAIGKIPHRYLKNETSDDELSAEEANMGENKLTEKKLTEKKLKAIKEMEKWDEQYEGGNPKIYDNGSSSFQEIVRKINELTKSKKEKLDFVFIDYLQLMSVDGFKGNDVKEVSKMTRQLKMLARSKDITIILLSQLSRAPEQRPNKIPKLSDLRSSGSIEQDADMVFFLYREKYYDPDSDNLNTLIKVAKHRDGETGEVEVRGEPEYMLVRDLKENEGDNDDYYDSNDNNYDNNNNNNTEQKEGSNDNNGDKDPWGF